jgi:hypothetical protein
VNISKYEITQKVDACLPVYRRYQLLRPISCVQLVHQNKPLKSFSFVHPDLSLYSSNAAVFSYYFLCTSHGSVLIVHVFCFRELHNCLYVQCKLPLTYSRRVVLATEHYVSYLTARIAFDPSRALCVKVRRLTGVCDPSK